MKSATGSILIQGFNLSLTQTTSEDGELPANPPTKENIVCYGNIVYSSLVTLLARKQTRHDPCIIKKKSSPQNGSVSHKVGALSRMWHRSWDLTSFPGSCVLECEQGNCEGQESLVSLLI